MVGWGGEEGMGWWDGGMERGLEGNVGTMNIRKLKIRLVM